MKSSIERRRVALLIETSNAYARNLLRGVRAYVREHSPWSLYLGEQRRGEPAPRWLKQWRGDGIIARIENPRIAEAVAAAHLPTIDVSAARLIPELPWVETDDEAIVQMAIEHLLERGFRNLAFCGDGGFRWSRNREAAFERAARAAGYAPHLFPSGKSVRGGTSWEKEQQRIAEWIVTLPKPVGLMACYDIRGRQVVDACRHLGVSVPDDVAVLGVDNDEMVCELADPPLSSVVPDAKRTGFEAAMLLDRMMAGEQVDPEGHLFPPIGLVSRQSTDVLAIDDPHVSQAVRYIREHACRGVRVEDVLRVVPLSRRALESRFKEKLSRTPHEEILRVRMARIKQLLVETKLNLAEIADRTAFAHVEYMSVAFKKQFGLSPSQYRQEHAVGKQRQ